MSDLQVLMVARGHLLNEAAVPRAHLTLPPKAVYPLALLELEEMWSPYLLKIGKRKGFQARVKFKVSLFSQGPGIEEAAFLSGKVKKVLEGTSLQLPEEQWVTFRFLACVAETSGTIRENQRTRVIYHFYDSIIRG